MGGGRVVDHGAREAADAAADNKRCRHPAGAGEPVRPTMVVTKTLTTPDEVASRRIAVPGKLTSAFLALSLYLG